MSAAARLAAGVLVVATFALPVHAAGVDAERCIPFLEADAAWKEAEATWTQAMAGLDLTDAAAATAGIEERHAKLEQARDALQQARSDHNAALEQAWDAYEEAMAALLQVGSDHNAALEQLMVTMRQRPYPTAAAMEQLTDALEQSGDALRQAGAAYEQAWDALRSILLAPARASRANAYWAAYSGPRSDNPEVMAKLIWSVVDRCRPLFGG